LAFRRRVQGRDAATGSLVEELKDREVAARAEADQLRSGIEERADNRIPRSVQQAGRRGPHPGGSSSIEPGSCYEQAESELGRVQVGELAVALGPPAGGEVVAEAAHCPLLGSGPDPGPD